MWSITREQESQTVNEALRNNEVMEREDGRPKQGQKVNER